MNNVLYIFLDEAGNLDFSTKGTDYFVLTSLTITRPFAGYQDLVNLRYDLIEYSDSNVQYNLEGFHASEDKQAVRDRVFHAIGRNLDEYRFDTLIVDKRRTDPALRELTRFYPKMVGYLLQHVLNGLNLDQYSEVIVLTDTIPFNKKRRVIEGETKKVLKGYMPKGKKFRVMHHSSKSNICLQIVDYCCWAVYRKWERNDKRSYDLIVRGLHSEFEIFRSGDKYYH